MYFGGNFRSVILYYHTITELILKTRLINTKMSRPIAETPVLRGKDARKFLAEMERNKDKKATPEERMRIKVNYDKLMSIATFRP
ncbi:hypothetical protein MMC2321_01924 [Chitinophaga sp. MM2321]